MGSKHACPLLQKEKLDIPRLLANLNFALGGDNACIFQGRLLYKHPYKDGSKQRTEMCRNARQAWKIVSQHWVMGP